MPKKGYLIAIEGADKAGKHTQVMNIVDYLRHKDVPAETLDFPQYNAFFGKLVKEYLNGKFGQIGDLSPEYKMMPYALDRLQHQPILRKWLRAGKWVVLDRYSYSNLFSVAQCPQSQWSEKINYLEELEFKQLGLMKPNHNIYLYLDPKIAFGMRDQGLKSYQDGKADLHERNYDLLYNVSKAYHHVASLNPATWTVVNEMKADGSRMNIAETFDALRPVIDRLLLEYGRKK